MRSFVKQSMCLRLLPAATQNRSGGRNVYKMSKHSFQRVQLPLKWNQQWTGVWRWFDGSEEDICSRSDRSVEETKPTTDLGTTVKRLENKTQIPQQEMAWMTKQTIYICMYIYIKNENLNKNNYPVLLSRFLKHLEKAVFCFFSFYKPLVINTLAKLHSACL